MFDKEINVAEIMKELQSKAKQKWVVEKRIDISVANNSISPDIKSIFDEVNRINDLIISMYNHTKNHEDTALKINIGSKKFVLLRKASTFIKRLVRKLTKFIWIEQNEVNKSLNASVRMLSESQLEMAKSLSIVNKLLENIVYVNERIDNIDNVEGKR